MSKNVIIIILWALLLAIIGIGTYHITKLYITRNKINNEGLETICTIKTKWRSHCGKGYGNSAVFIMRVGGKEMEFISECNVPGEVAVGDKYAVKYLKEDPDKNIVLFDKKLQ